MDLYCASSGCRIYLGFFISLFACPYHLCRLFLHHRFDSWTSWQQTKCTKFIQSVWCVPELPRQASIPQNRYHTGGEMESAQVPPTAIDASTRTELGMKGPMAEGRELENPMNPRDRNVEAPNTKKRESRATQESVKKNRDENIMGVIRPSPSKPPTALTGYRRITAVFSANEALRDTSIHHPISSDTLSTSPSGGHP